MHKSLLNHALIVILAIFILGCSGVSDIPILPQDNQGEPQGIQTPLNEKPLERNIDSQRVLWGIWNVMFDPVECKVTVEPARNLQVHFNITDMILPPACDDCFDVAIKGFNPVTRILDADITLRNPTPINGRDVRGILHTNDHGHLLKNPDDWTGFWDAPGGGTINPFIAFAKDEPYRVFAGHAEHTENFRVYIPKPPAYFAITFAVDASWPGNCKEPYSIEDFIQEGQLLPTGGSSVDISMTVLDWQNDDKLAQISVPEIIGPDWADFNSLGGGQWELNLVNSEAAPPGDYEALIRVTSENVEGTYLYDYVTITVSNTDDPFVTSIDPPSGNLNDNIYGAAVSGGNFLGPCDVELKLGAYTITATSVEVLDPGNISCDIYIPLEADIGLYDVVVKNADEKLATGPDLFEVISPFPVVTSIIPESNFVNQHTGGAEISGSNFLSPCIVDLVRGSYTITSSNVDVQGEATIICDFDIPIDAEIGLYDVVVTNYNELQGVGAELFTVVCPVPIIDSADPPAGLAGETIVEMEVHGDNFIYPGMQLSLKMDGETDIVAYNIVSVYPTLFYCDLFIPQGTTPGMWDMEITNGCGESTVWEDSFEINSPSGWCRTWGGPDEDDGFDVAIDDAGNAYVTGFFRSTVDFDPGPGVEERTAVGSEDVFLCKFRPNKELAWVATWGSSSGDRGQGVAVDDDGVVLVTGWFQGACDFDPDTGTEMRTPIGATDAFLSAFSPEGEFYGVNTWGGATTDGGGGVITDGPDVYVTGHFSGVVDFDWDPVGEAIRTSVGANDIFILKVIGEGNFGWVQTWGGTGNDQGESVAVDSHGDIYVCGNAKGYSVDFDPDPVDTDYIDGGANSWAFLSKFDATGDYLWAGRWGNNSDANAADVAVDGYDDIYVSGHYMWYTIDLNPGAGVDEHACIGNADCYMSKFDSLGNYIWGYHWGGTENDRAYGIAANSFGDIFVSGEFDTSADLDPDAVDEDIHTGFGQNAFFCKFDPTGDYIWGRSWGVMNSAVARGIAANDAGDSWVTGWFDGTDIDMDPDPVGEDLHTSNGDQDPSLTKFLPDGAW